MSSQQSDKDKTMAATEKLFHSAMINVYEVAKRKCNYTASYFLRTVLDHGGLEAAKQLLAKSEPSEGFTTLWMCGCLDLTVEALVIKPEFQVLFTPEEIDIARSRLQQLGYKFTA